MEQLLIAEGERLENEEAKSGSGEAGSSGGGGSNKAYKTNEARRLEELESYFNKRRASRIAEDDRLEQLLIEAKLEEEEASEDGENGVELDEGFFEDRSARSLSTTMAPRINFGGKENKEDRADDAKSDKRVVVAASSDSIPHDDDEDYTDITHDSFKERDTPSLATTMSPSNRGASATQLQAKKEGPEEECIDEEDCWDITRSDFSERQQKSLATTLPPTNRRNATAADMLPKKATKGNNKTREGDDSFFDITHNLFPDGSSRGRTFQSLSTPRQRLTSGSAFGEGEKSEMDASNPRFKSIDRMDPTAEASNASRNSVPSSVATAPSRNRDDTKNSSKSPSNKELRGDDEAVFDITQNLFPESRGRTFHSQSTSRQLSSSSRSAFEDEGWKSEMNVPNSRFYTAKRKKVGTVPASPQSTTDITTDSKYEIGGGKDSVESASSSISVQSEDELTAEEAELARYAKLAAAYITEGLTAEEAEAARLQRIRDADEVAKKLRPEKESVSVASASSKVSNTPASTSKTVTGNDSSAKPTSEEEKSEMKDPKSSALETTVDENLAATTSAGDATPSASIDEDEIEARTVERLLCIEGFSRNDDQFSKKRSDQR